MRFLAPLLLLLAWVTGGCANSSARAPGPRRPLYAITAPTAEELAAFEEEIRSAQSLAGMKRDPALFRQASLADDLTALHGPGWLERFSLKPATQAYIARLQDLGTAQPALLVAHAYVRYLGDLSGGQMLRQIVARSYGLTTDVGSRFYGFGDSAAVQVHLHAFRAGLAALAASPERIDALVVEARSAFARHVDLFDELALAPDQPLPTKLRI